MRQETFYKSLDFGFHFQYMQNSLQLNNGVFDSIPVFSNISLFAGVAYTDWSWGGLFMDMDNDGNQDLFVTNGVLKDINNQDILANPRSSSYFNTRPKEYRPELFPSTPVRNFAFRNNGDLTFRNKAELWGFDGLTLTNGVSYGDFDNDGDLDLVVHNVSEHSAIYVNKVVSKDNHFLKIRLNGPVNNPFGVGSIVLVHTNDITQKQELTLTRGYQSSVPPVFHFGLGAHAVIDMLTIVWPDGKKQVLNNLEADKTLVLNYSDALMSESENTEVRKMFKDITLQSGISFIHQEDDYDDFRYEPLLPYKISHIGPGLAVGDINNDGLEDFFIGNGAGSASALFIQSPHGNFK